MELFHTRTEVAGKIIQKGKAIGYLYLALESDRGAEYWTLSFSEG